MMEVVVHADALEDLLLVFSLAVPSARLSHHGTRTQNRIQGPSVKMRDRGPDGGDLFPGALVRELSAYLHKLASRRPAPAVGAVHHSSRTTQCGDARRAEQDPVTRARLLSESRRGSPSAVRRQSGRAP
jgi:hypothetical protein